MAGKERRASGFSAKIGKFVAEERLKQKDNGKPWSQQRLADEMNKHLIDQNAEWQVTKQDVLRIENGAKEIRGSEIYALSKVLKLSPAILMDPDAARSRRLADYKAALRTARDAAWQACAAIYDEGRKSETRLAHPGYVRAFTEVFSELPPSSDAPPAAAPSIRDALQALAWLGVDHRERGVKLSDRAAALEQELADMERFRADYLELLMYQPEYDRRVVAAEYELDDVKQQRATADEYLGEARS